MKFEITVEDLCHWLADAVVDGPRDAVLTGIATLADAAPGDISFLGNPRYSAQLSGCRASVVLVPAAESAQPAPGQAFVRVANPSAALGRICEQLAAQSVVTRQPGIHPTTIVAASARIDPTAHIGPLCVVEDGAVIGAGAVLVAQCFVGRAAQVGELTELRARVTIEYGCIIGARCLLHSGVVIGSDGFGFDSRRDGHHKIPQVGIVLVEDAVEIGANCAVEHARFVRTTIGRSSKLDNLVHIGHNVQVGPHNLLCGQVGIAGSSKTGAFVTMAGQVGVVGHVELGDRVMIGGQAGVTKNFPAGSIINGTPARPMKERMRSEARVAKLEQLYARVARLEAALGAGGPPPASSTLPACDLSTDE
jgi:UDP-3-O-[3-hydroxymyristoyl] glucosamine N-acyltransferase